MSKTIFETAVGGDGAKAGMYIDKEVTKIEVSIPTEKIAEPALKAIDMAIDKIEQWIPGDQTGLAAKLKEEARKELLSLLGEP